MGTYKQHFILLTIILAAMSGLSACTSPTPPSEAAPEPTEEGRALVLGDISDDPGEVIEGAQPLANFLASQLGEYGITEGQAKVASSTEQMIELLRSGEVDLYFDSVYPAMLIGDASGAQPILRRWRNGVEEYYTVIFTVEGSGVSSLDDLNGKIVAMDNAYSTSGYVLPAVTLIEHGLSLRIVDSFEDAVEPDEVGVVFSYDDENTLQWVTSGRAQAGATDDYHFGVYSEQVELISLGQTEAVPRQVVIVRPGMEPDLLEAIKQALLGADDSEAGRAALEQFDGTAKFDEFPEGIDAALERMREMSAVVEQVEGAPTAP